jgi:hypothetical protein
MQKQLFFNKLCNIFNQKKEKKARKKKITSKWVQRFRIDIYKQWGLKFRKIIKKSLTFLSHLILEKFIMDK